MNKERKTRFKATILDFFKKNGRHNLPWRNTRDPYKILVSEVMLQQTQVSRVLTKYPEFLKRFPDTKTLARAKTADVLHVWLGLGYNRRALALKRAAEEIEGRFGGTFPKTGAELESLPGIGQSTRGAILAFAFGIPTVFIETNIRSVFIHAFFESKNGNRNKKSKTDEKIIPIIHDKDILPLIEETLDTKNSREWYYALMDYGVHLKQTLPNPSRKSIHHVKQSPFKGSRREVRAKILSYVLASTSPLTKSEIKKHIKKIVGKTPYDVDEILLKLVKEGLIRKIGQNFRA